MSGDRQGRLTWVAALVLAVALCALAVLLVFRDHGGAGGERSALEGSAQASQQDPIAASATFDHPIVLFGDTLTANVDVVIDRTVVDPSKVSVKWNSAPWSPIALPQRRLELAGSTAHLRMTYVLRCLTSVCAPVRETDRIDLDQARVAYRAPVDNTLRDLSLRVQWPTLIVHTRVGDIDPAASDALAAPWRADLASVPAVSYRIPPWLAITLLVVLGVALLVLAAVVLYRAWPRREPKPEPEPEPEPELVASLLEQALELLESSSADGEEERRRALELVADEVERVGDQELAVGARALAWSPVPPQAARTQELAALLRERLADVLEAEHDSVNGDDPDERRNGGPA